MVADPLLEHPGISDGSPDRSILHLAQISLYRSIILRRHSEGLSRKLPPQLIWDRLMLVQSSDQHVVLRGSCQRRDSVVQERALRCSTDQGYASNIDIVDRPSQIRRIVLHNLPKRIQVYNDIIYWLDGVLLQLFP